MEPNEKSLRNMSSAKEGTPQGIVSSEQEHGCGELRNMSSTKDGTPQGNVSSDQEEHGCGEHRNEGVDNFPTRRISHPQNQWSMSPRRISLAPLERRVSSVVPLNARERRLSTVAPPTDPVERRLSMVMQEGYPPRRVSNTIIPDYPP